MKNPHRSIPVCAFLVLATPLALGGALEDFVNAPDENYSYCLASTIEGEGYTAYVLDMTSQSWKEGDVTPHLWRHWVTVVKPESVGFDKALLVISGGNNKHDAPPDKVWPVLEEMAVSTRSVTAFLQGVPSEPVVFAEEGKSRSEDEIIAYSFTKFTDTLDPTWPLLCPMVKSAVRAMDSIQDFLASSVSPPVAINGFVVTGGSKRGWTTWLTGAVDPRVVAIAPMVIDVLNFRPQMDAQRASYGDYSEEISDYSELNLMDLLDEPEGEALTDIVDPYEYRSDLTMPKLVMLGVGDPYWTVDAAKYYFPKLKGPKLLHYEPNVGHGVTGGPGAIPALRAFHHMVLIEEPFPKFTWRLRRDGRFRVKAKDRPEEVRLWKAHSTKRDFRIPTIGEAWTSEIVEDNGNGVYKGRVPRTAAGYTAYYLELVYPSKLGFRYGLTTLTCVIE